jgi:hypothetical protein
MLVGIIGMASFDLFLWLNKSLIEVLNSLLERLNSGNDALSNVSCDVLLEILNNERDRNLLHFFHKLLESTLIEHVFDALVLVNGVDLLGIVEFLADLLK